MKITREELKQLRDGEPAPFDVTTGSLLWDDRFGECVVIEHPDRHDGPYRDLRKSTFACINSDHMTQEQKERWVMRTFLQLVLRDNVPLEMAHHEFMKLQEYRDIMSDPYRKE
jgi:hypothetical protein